MKNMLQVRAMPILLLFIAFSSSRLQAQQNAHLSDPEIASVAVVANQVDIKAGEQARQKSHNSDVRNFAETMINDHRSVIDKATALVKKLKVTPKTNALSRQLAAQGLKMRKSLEGKKGSAFDKAYIDNEVAYHKAVIAAVNEQLIPQAQNAELKQLLQSVAPVLQTHLEHAEMVQKKIAGK